MAGVYTHRNFYTDTLLHTEKLLHTASFYWQNPLHTASFYRKKLLHRETFLYIITAGIAAPKPDLDAKAKKDDFEALFKRKTTTCETRVQEKNAMDHLGLKKRDGKQKLR